jgi:hypothetical protein
VTMQCSAGYYGAVGSRCTSCPEGGVCDGGLAMPVAGEGFFPAVTPTRSDSDGGSGSSESRTFEFVQCTPPEACIGGDNATCAPLYKADRCSDCVVGAYRCGTCHCQRHQCCCLTSVYVCVSVRSYRLTLSKLVPLKQLIMPLVSCRSKGECVPCPNTAWLLLLMFLLALGTFVLGAVYLSRKRLNLAALGIGLVSALFTHAQSCARC